MYQQISAAESIVRFTRLSVVWLSIIFGAVWFACWLVGVGVPLLLQQYVHPLQIARQCSAVVQLLVPIVAIMVFIPINAMFMVLCERRALAMFTVRLGPNRVGPDGLLQTAADAVKLLLKEDITPAGADALMFTLAPILFFAPSIIGALPLLAVVTANNRFFSICGIPTGIFYILAVSSIPVVGLVMGAWASNNKYSLVGGLRSAAQAISYEIPLVLSIITVCMLANSLDLVEIAYKQAGNIFHWNILGGGALAHAAVGMVGSIAGHVLVRAVSLIAAVLLAACCILLFGIYITSATAEVNRIPFDLPEAESELVSGYNTEYGGIKFAIFFLAEFTNLFVISTIAAVVFLGGGNGPWGPLDTAMIAGLQQLIVSFPVLGLFISPNTLVAALWIILKTYSLVIFAILVRGTLPRFRIDQLMDFGWKRLIPLSLILLTAVMYLKELAWL
jgi:NADH-quinone oxidoreductase subunit H